MKSGNKINMEIYYQTVMNNQTNMKMKLKDLHKAAIVYKEIMDLDKDIMKITEFAKLIADISNKMELMINDKINTCLSNQFNLQTISGDQLTVQTRTPTFKLDEKDILKIDIDQADVLRILQLILNKKKEEKYYLFQQTKNI